MVVGIDWVVLNEIVVIILWDYVAWAAIWYVWETMVPVGFIANQIWICLWHTLFSPAAQVATSAISSALDKKPHPWSSCVILVYLREK